MLGASGVFGFFLADLCMVKAFLLIGPRLSLLVGSLTPPLTAILSWMWIGDKLGWCDWVAMGVTLAGVVWVVAEQPNGDHPHARHRGRGVLLAAAASAVMAVGYVLAKDGLGDYDAVAATLIRVLVALPFYALLITVWHRWPAMLAAVQHRRVMLIVTFGAIVGPFVGRGLQHDRPAPLPRRRRDHDHRHFAGADPAVQRLPAPRARQPPRRRRGHHRRGRCRPADAALRVTG